MEKRKKSSALLVYFLVFVLTFVLSFLFLNEVYKCLQKFGIKYDLLGAASMLRIIVAISGVFSLFNALIVAKKIRTLKVSKVGFWLDTNYPKIILGYIILLLFMGSITEKTIWTASEINDVLSIEWTIFGLSLTIFLVWNVLIVDFLQKKQPISTENPDYFQKYALLLEKQSFSQEVETTFSTTVLLSINLVLLLLASMFVYIVHKPEMLLSQNVVCCAFYFSINTIISLFFDLLKPLKADKDKLKKQNQVSKEELDTAQMGAFVHTLFSEGVKQINESNKYSEDEKKQLSALYVEVMRDALLEIANKDSKDKNTKHLDANAEQSKE